MNPNTKITSLNTLPDFAKSVQAGYILMVLPQGTSLPKVAGLSSLATLKTTLARRRVKVEDLSQTPIATELDNGSILVWTMLDAKQSRFEQHTTLRKALQLLLGEYPEQVSIVVLGNAALNKIAAEEAVYVALVNSAALPQHKQKNPYRPLKSLNVYGHKIADPSSLQARALGNILTRQLTQLPPNELTPLLYRKRIKKLSSAYGWKMVEYDLNRLRKMGAGAFVAVAQGSSEGDAAIVHLQYRTTKSAPTVALVGKGICFDTGGHNLKPAKYMHGMHEDMNGSAVALGILAATTQLKLAVNIDAWLAIAQNHISPTAYKQNDIVKALNGTTIEIMHTDAEGRMVLADALTMAGQNNPDLTLDFATLTGSMVAALGTRYSGIFSTSPALLKQALNAGKEAGERVWAFPLDADYETPLESKVADIKQCTLDPDPDHILAARFLLRFAGERPWIHMDLSASSCEGGLGAITSNTTGFGVGWGLALLQTYIKEKK